MRRNVEYFEYFWICACCVKSQLMLDENFQGKLIQATECETFSFRFCMLAVVLFSVLDFPCEC